MDFRLIELQETDDVLISHNIGAIPPQEVDAYCEKLMPKLAEIFGKGRVALLPVREGPTWDFVIIRKK